MEKIDKKKKGTSPGNIIFVGCMFLGIGLGMYFHSTGIGTLIGMGVGFIF
jgi:hypothetical protein